MPRTICFLIYEGFQILDMAGPIGAFEAANWHAGGDAYRLQIAALKEGLVSSSSGAQVQARAIADVRRIDTLIVVGGFGSVQKRHDSGIANALRRRSAGARRVCSVCSGAQLLAAAGLLDGKRATTHWRVAGQLSREHPEVQVSPDAIFTHDDRFWTSAGVSAGIDLALALIEQDLGKDISRAAARELVVYHRRPGGQSQFSTLSELDSGDRFADLLSWARENLSEPLTVEQLAEHQGMSSRNFSRTFLAETGMTPARAIERLRVETARTQIEESRQPFSSIAETCGFGDADRMRRAFLRRLGRSPQEVRRAAS